MQLVMAGNDTEGLRYGSIQTQEKYYLTWKEDSGTENLLDRGLIQMCSKARFLELIHDFILFDAGTKKLCRHNQYFAVRASQEHVERREGGIIWNTQGSGKSLIMVWLTKWLREHVNDARVLLITDRKELDEQIERVFKGVNEDIYRTKTGADLIEKLNATADESPINPKYYEKMSELLDALIKHRRQDAIAYEERIVELTKQSTTSFCRIGAR